MAKFIKEYQGQRVGVQIYKVSGHEGMTKQEIINACDPNNWGGNVMGNIVEVYVD